MKKTWKIILSFTLLGAAAVAFNHHSGDVATSKLKSTITNIQKVEINRSGKTLTITHAVSLVRLRKSLLELNNSWEIMHTTRVAPKENITIYPSHGYSPINFGYSDRNIMFYWGQDFYYIKSASEANVKELKSLFDSLIAGSIKH